MRSFDVFFDLPWINGWVNIREADDLRRYRVRYDVTAVMMFHAAEVLKLHAIHLRYHQFQTPIYHEQQDVYAGKWLRHYRPST